MVAEIVERVFWLNAWRAMENSSFFFSKLQLVTTRTLASLRLCEEMFLRTTASREHRFSPMVLSSLLPSSVPSLLRYLEMMALARLASHCPFDESIKADSVSI